MFADLVLFLLGFGGLLFSVGNNGYIPSNWLMPVGIIILLCMLQFVVVLVWSWLKSKVKTAMKSN